MNQSIAKVLQGSSLYLERQKTKPIIGENIWRGPVVILRSVASTNEATPRYPVISSSSINLFPYEAYALTGFVCGQTEPVLVHKDCRDVSLVVNDYFIG